MKRECRQPTPREWKASERSARVKIPKTETDEERLERIAAERLDAQLEDEDMFSWREVLPAASPDEVTKARVVRGGAWTP